VILSENALSLDGSADTNRNARGLLAYSYTVRWGEHQHDEANREGAEKNVRAGLEAKEATSYLHAADAMLDYYNGRGSQALKKIDERIKVAEAERKQYALYYLTRGILQMNTGDLEDSRESLERAQAIAPDDARVFVALGTLHRRRGADMQGLQAYNNALKYTRNSHPDALLGTANLILDQAEPGRGYNTAAKYVKTLLEMEPPPSPRQLAQAHFVRAFIVSRVSVDLPAYKDEVRKALEEGTGVSADPAAAQKEIQKEEAEGMTLDRNNPELLLVRARRLAWEKKLDEASAELKKAIDANSSAAHYHVELAKVLMRKEGGEPQAEAALQKALSMVQNSPKLLSMLGQVQYRQKNFAGAMATLERATGDEKQKNPEARFLLGKIYSDERKDFDKAIALLTRAAAEYFADPSQAAAAYDELAVSYELRGKDAGDKDKARTSYEKSLNADKEYAPAYCHYVKFLAKLNDPKEREKVKALAAEGLKLDPQGACAGDLQHFKQD
jgi:tetratricopeptide (TPR) repeat protein